MGRCQHVSWENWFGVLLLSLIVSLFALQVHEQLGSAVFHGLGRRLWSTRWWVCVKAKDLGRCAGGTVQTILILWALSCSPDVVHTNRRLVSGRAKNSRNAVCTAFGFTKKAPFWLPTLIACHWSVLQSSMSPKTSMSLGLSK